MSTEIKKSLEGVYELISESYAGNWQYRWKDTPYLERAIEEGKVESVSGHVWGTTEFWFHLRRICPNLDLAVNAIEVYEILVSHDLGETYSGDIPLYRKVHGESDNKKDERASLERITSSVGSERLREIVASFDEFEAEVSRIDRAEVLVAKWIDNLQGNHFALTFGKDLPKYSKPINGILQMRFVPYTNRLLEVLEQNGQNDAANEVRLVAQHHTETIIAAGIDFDASGLNT